MKLMMESEMDFVMDDRRFRSSLIRSDKIYVGIVDDESRENGVDGTTDGRLIDLSVE